MKENRRDIRIVGSATAIASTIIGIAGLVSGVPGLPVMAAVTVALLIGCGVLRISEIREDAVAARNRVRSMRVGPDGVGAFRDNVSTGARAMGQDIRTGLRDIRNNLRGGGRDG